MKKQVVGVFGGAFDPIHRGHMKIAKQAMNSLPIERLLLIPNGDPYYREAPSASWAHRMKMAEIAIDDLGEEGKGIEVSDLEPPGRPRYTVDTVNLLRDRGMHPIVIAGADSFGSLKSWYKWTELPYKASFAVADRIEAPKLEKTLKILESFMKFVVAETAEDLAKQPCVWGWDLKPEQCSSTTLRARLVGGNADEPCLSKEVSNHISGNELYWGRLFRDPIENE